MSRGTGKAGNYLCYNEMLSAHLNLVHATHHCVLWFGGHYGKSDFISCLDSDFSSHTL